MSAQAAHEIKIYAVKQVDATAAPTAVTDYTEIGTLDSCDFNETRISLDKTDFKSTSGAKEYFLGLKEGTVSLSGFYDPSGDTGVDEIRLGFDGSSDAVVWFMIAWTGTPADGTTHVKTVCTSFQRSGGVDERINLTTELMFSGAPTAGPTT